jgi:hypothetical protein
LLTSPRESDECRHSENAPDVMSRYRKNDNELCRAPASASTALPRGPKAISGNSSKIALAVARSSKGTGEAGGASVDAP